MTYAIGYPDRPNIFTNSSTAISGGVCPGSDGGSTLRVTKARIVNPPSGVVTQAVAPVCGRDASPFIPAKASQITLAACPDLIATV